LEKTAASAIYTLPEESVATPAGATGFTFVGQMVKMSAGVTSRAIETVIPPDVADIVVVPSVIGVATPPEFMLITPEFVEPHVTELAGMDFRLPSE